MLGFTFQAGKKFAIEKYGEAVWEKAAAESGVGTKDYVRHKAYPDSEVAAMFTAIAKTVGVELPEVIEAFGVFSAPAFIEMAGVLVRPEWRTLDLLEHVEEKIHTRIRDQNAEAKPPFLVVTRLSPDSVRIVYASSRKLCPAVIGITKGVAQGFHETVSLVEERCMYRGDPSCAIVVTLQH